MSAAGRAGAAAPAPGSLSGRQHGDDRPGRLGKSGLTRAVSMARGTAKAEEKLVGGLCWRRVASLAACHGQRWIRSGPRVRMLPLPGLIAGGKRGVLPMRL